MDLLVIAPTCHKSTSITLTDMLDCDLEMALKIEEYLDILDSFEELEIKEAQKKNEMSRQR